MNGPQDRVLIVDDDPSFAGMVAEILAEKGFDTVLTTTPDEALAQARSGQFSAAIIDLVMPTVNGIELGDRIKELSQDTQILVLTAHADMDTAIKGIQHGIFDYLQKQTIQIPRLERSIREAVDKSRLTRENRVLLQRLSESNQMLKALHDISADLTGEAHLDRLMNKLIAAAKELCNAATGRVLLLEKSSDGEQTIVAGTGDGAAALQGAHLKPGEGIATLALEKEQPVEAESPKTEPRYSHRCDEMPTKLSGLLCAPLSHGPVRGVVMVGGHKKEAFTEADHEVLGRLARQAAISIANALYHDRAVNFFTHTSDLLVSILESLDVFYPGHSRGVAALADMLTRRLGLPDEQRRNVHFGALLHDIGKLRLDPAILKGETISPTARIHLQEHPSMGLDVLRPITLWEEMLPIIHAHHERWDGKGYPRGLVGEEIPLGARIVAVADSFDAMTRARPHGPQRTVEGALAELEAHSGTQFDPRIVRLFVTTYRQHKDTLPFQPGSPARGLG